MHLRQWMPWVGAVLSAVLLELPFPIAGPMPPWRGIFAFIGLVPLLWAVLAEEKQASGAKARREDAAGNAGAKAPAHQLRRHPLRRAFLLGYLCGVLWYAGNCYWIYNTMQIHGGMPPIGAAGMLLGFSAVLGGYFGLSALALEFVRSRKGVGWALAAVPFFWVALDLAAARITSVPWDQLGYSQVDNGYLTILAPITGVYGITFLLVLVNVLLAASILRPRSRAAWVGAVAALLVVSAIELARTPDLVTSLDTVALQAPSATAVLMQPNLDVAALNSWPGPAWDQHIAEFTHFATQPCGAALYGIPETNASTADSCGQPSLLAWPESPAPYFEDEDRFRNAMKGIAQTARSPLVIGGVGMEPSEEGGWREYNSAIVFDAQGNRIGRYDKIHLVPFGEFVPYRDLFFFAKKLTRKVDDLTRGTSRNVFRLENAQGNAHRYGVFICYEAVFADEVREFAKNGAEVFVNISDDGWYGDTSAPWQHFNIARMRAIENRRWILRDTNNGITAAIDPYGRVRQSIPRHSVGALVAQYGFNSETTFYTEHGDVFAWLCAILSIGLVAWSWNKRGGSQVLHKVRS